MICLKLSPSLFLPKSLFDKLDEYVEIDVESIAKKMSLDKSKVFDFSYKSTNFEKKLSLSLE